MNKIAIFFDAENVPAKKVPNIISEIAKEGDILFQRAYADWSIPNTRSWKNQITKTPITAFQQFQHDQGQAVDKAIMMDAIELALKHEEIDTFVIVASDNGYYSLALKLRELGKKIIGLGEKPKCLPIWINSCNKFIYFEDLEEDDEDILLQKDISDKDQEILGKFALESFLEKAYNSTPFYKETNTVLMSQLWESVLRMKPDFNIKDFNKKSVKELIESINFFKLTDDGKPQRTFFVEKIEQETKDDLSERKTGVVKRRIGRYRIISATDGSGDYFFYMSEINKNFKDKKVDKNCLVDFLVVKNPDPNSDEVKNKNGRAKDLRVIKE